MKSYYENKQFYSVSDPEHTISIRSNQVNNNGRNQYHVSAMEDGYPVSVEQAKRDINNMNDSEIDSMFKGFGKKKRRHSCKRRIYKKKSHTK